MLFLRARSNVLDIKLIYQCSMITFFEVCLLKRWDGATWQMKDEAPHILSCSSCCSSPRTGKQVIFQEVKSQPSRVSQPHRNTTAFGEVVQTGHVPHYWFMKREAWNRKLNFIRDGREAESELYWIKRYRSSSLLDLKLWMLHRLGLE